MSLTLNKSACSVEGIPSSCSTLEGLTYMRGTVMATVEGGRADIRNSYESVIVSMAFNAQPVRLIDGDLLCMYLIKGPNLRRSPLYLSCGDEIH